MKTFLLLSVLAASPEATRWWSHVEFMADDQREGRNTGSVGHRQSCEYVAQEFERAGLRPGGATGYFQTAKFAVRQIDETRSSLALERDGVVTPLTLGEEAYFSVRTNLATSLKAKMVFAGYGLTVPEYSWNDLASLDVKGKIVLVLSGGPKKIPAAVKSHYQSVPERWSALEKAGAIGMAMFSATSDVPWERAKLARLQPAMVLADPKLQDARTQRMSLTINPAHLDKLLAGSGHSAKEILDIAARDGDLPKFELPSTLIARTAVKRSSVESQNVIGIVPGSDPALRNEVIVLSAHIDHLGVGEPVNGDRIYNGAMDNAIGVASLIEVARALKGKPLQRSVAFAAVTAEEKGLLGSRFLAKDPALKGMTMVANINLDMYLPLFPLKVMRVLGIEESTMGAIVKEAAAARQIEVQGDLQPERNSFIRSDQYSFIKRGIPAVNLGFGAPAGSPEAQVRADWLKQRYHAPSDDLQQPVDKEAAIVFNGVLGDVLVRLANQPERPRWLESSFFRRFSR
jgi:hypothetical protein